MNFNIGGYRDRTPNISLAYLNYSGEANYFCPKPLQDEPCEEFAWDQT